MDSRPSHITLRAVREGEPVPLAILEIGFQPMLRDAFPTQTRFVDTRFRWNDVRTYERRTSNLGRRVVKIFQELVQAFGCCRHQNYDVVVARCLGPVNSESKSWPGHLGLVLMGAAFRWFVLYAARGRRVTLAIVDVTDHITIHPRDRRFVRECQLYFKRELADNLWHSLEAVLPRGTCAGASRNLPAGTELRSKLRPFAIGIEGTAIAPPIPSREKNYDLFYAGTSGGIPAREELGVALQILAERGWRVHAPRERLSVEEFRAAVRQSRLCLSPGGVGWDCYRHYEIAALGSIPVMNYRAIRSIAPFRHGRECFYYDPQDGLADCLINWLKLPDDDLDAMARAAQDHLTQHFTLDALARYALREIGLLAQPRETMSSSTFPLQN